MSLPVNILPEADHDIDNACAWYADQASVEVAIRFLDAVRDAIKELPDMPGRGRPWPFRQARNRGLRSWRIRAFPRYLIFYQAFDNRIEVVRVLHGMRDLENLLGPT